MTDATVPAIGDRVLQHGRWHEVTELGHAQGKDEAGNAVLVATTTYENRRYKSTCLTHELVLHGDGWWYLPGRILARDERVLAETVTGAWPPAESHLGLRAMLDGVDLDEVDQDRMAVVLGARIPEPRKAPDCLAHVALLRAVRTDDPTGEVWQKGWQAEVAEQAAAAEAQQAERAAEREEAENG